jgi:putative DNA primase/helicase
MPQHSVLELPPDELVPDPDYGGPILEIAYLAGLDTIAYDRCRTDAAKRLGVRVSTLDATVKNARGTHATDQAQGDAFEIADVEPWADPVDGTELLAELTATIRRYLVLPALADAIMALWILMTYLLDVLTVAPILAITSPEKGCGKTTALDIVSRLARRVLPASNISSAALYRSVEKWQPTLLIDEADSFATRNDELRGVMNSGHTRQTAYVVRCVGDDSEPRRFGTWGCKAVAAIGRLPDTVIDRSIEIRLRRALPGEAPEKLRHASRSDFDALARKAARWAADNAKAIQSARPAIPEGLSNRMANNVEPLLAIC